MAGTVNHSRIKVAVIGSGAAGLCAGRHLISEPEKFQFDIFEQQDDVGGTWRYSSRVGSDEYGLPVHSSMYKNLRKNGTYVLTQPLWHDLGFSTDGKVRKLVLERFPNYRDLSTNLPKEVMAFPDFPFPDCDGQSFVHHTVVLQYLEEYTKQYDLYPQIKFHTLVENVEPVEHSNDKVEWLVDIRDVASNERSRFVYDAVMVCNGHYSVPYIPKIPGLDTFDGLLMHSHDYREESKFQNLKVVVLGAGASGIDIAIEISNVSKEVVLSHNTPPKTCRLPSNMTQEKGIESVQKSSVTFIGGKMYQCDAILICTGYLYTYPFFHPKCKIEIGDQKVSPLYLHLFHIDYPTLAIWAVPKLIIPFPIYDQQVKVFLKFLKGIVKLPSKEEMRAEAERDFLKRLESGFKPRHAHVMPGDLQWEYDDKLSELGKIKPIPDAVRNLFKHVHFTRTQDVLNYKNVNYSILDEKTFLKIE